jgi:hypothetical protein
MAENSCGFRGPKDRLESSRLNIPEREGRSVAVDPRDETIRMDPMDTQAEGFPLNFQRRSLEGGTNGQDRIEGTGFHRQ